MFYETPNILSWLPFSVELFCFCYKYIEKICHGPWKWSEEIQYLLKIMPYASIEIVIALFE